MFGKRHTSDVVALDEHRKISRADAQGTPPEAEPAVPLKDDEIYRIDVIEMTAQETFERAEDELSGQDIQAITRRELAEKIGNLVNGDLVAGGLGPRERRDVVTAVVNRLLEGHKDEAKARAEDTLVERTKMIVQPILMDRIDVAEAGDMPRQQLAQEIGDIVSEILVEHKIQLNLLEQREIVTMLLNDMLGFGPLEVLLSDEAVTDIMVNGADQVYVERGGKLVLSDVKFRDNRHVMQIASRIVSGVGRRVDESSPLCDARLPDGSRVNIIIPPLAIDGPSISIRKFAKKKITLDVMQRQENLSPEMATVLKIASRARLNILVSGGTGSGKTTLLNALSRMIDGGERIVTIEDAAELQLQQPHVVRLETRPPNLEGSGKVTMTDLVKNCLRMRPDRIIVGEVRGPEAFDLLQAMNTGHDGSMGTLHANSPREALSRVESMITMGGFSLPQRTIREMIVGSIDVVVQASRLRDGSRKIVSVSEVMGLEGDVIVTQDVLRYEIDGEDENGKLIGRHRGTGVGRPRFWERAKYYNLEGDLAKAIDDLEAEG